MTQDEANAILAQAGRYADRVAANELSFNNKGYVLKQEESLERDAYMKLSQMLQEAVS